MSTQSTAHKVNGPAANAAQGVDSVGHRGTPTKPVSTRKTSSRGQTGSTSGQQAQHMAPVQSQPGQPLQLAQPETPDTHVRTLGGGRPPRHSPAVAPEVHQQQGSPRSKEVQRPEIQGPAGDSNQQQPPLGNPRLSEPAVGSPQQTQKGQAQAVDVTPGLQQTQARAPSQSGASVDRHHASHAQQHSQDNNSVEAYYSAGSGVQPVISVMAPVTESNGSIEADLRGCTPDELK